MEVRARRRLSIVLFAMAIVSAACGSRLSRSEVLAENRTVGAASQSDFAPGSGSEGAAATVGGPSAGASTGATGPGSNGSSTASGGKSGASNTGAAGAASNAGTKAPIVVGFIGWFGGIGGTIGAPMRDAWVAWSKMVNARGGINGHPVKLLLGDNGGNESQTLSLMRDFVENQGAIAVSLYQTPITAESNYAKSKGIPIVGVLPNDPDWQSNPYMFPPYPNVDGAAWGAAHVLKMDGVTKVATEYCVENGSCAVGNSAFVNHAKQEGIQVVYQGQISLTAPDYTAECIQMRNAGATSVWVIAENETFIRLAQSCDRQGFHPTFAGGAGADAMAKVPALEGMISPTQTFPWFLRSDSPAVAEYAQALQKYVPDRLTDGVSTQTGAWLSAKLFEMAAQNVGDKPTSQDILTGLWAMKGETFGGLAAGPAARTFVRNQSTPDTYCVFEGRISQRKWVAPRGLTPVCR